MGAAVGLGLALAFAFLSVQFAMGGIQLTRYSLGIAFLGSMAVLVYAVFAHRAGRVIRQIARVALVLSSGLILFLGTILATASISHGSVQPLFFYLLAADLLIGGFIGERVWKRSRYGRSENWQTGLRCKS